MKKNSLFKILGITFLVAVILTWIFKTASYSGELAIGERAQIGLYDMIQYMFYSLRFFSGIMIFVLLTGALYGVLGATGVYEKFVNTLAKKFKKNANLVLIIIIALLAILSAFVGLNFAMFVFFPFLISLIMAMGYDKIIAIGATLGGTIVGMIGSIFSANMLTVINGTLSITYTSELLMKCILLVLGIGVLILFTMLYVKRNKKAKIAVEKTDKKLADKENSKSSILPLIIIFGLMFLIMVVGTFDWSGAASIELFTNIHNAIMGVQIGDFAIFQKIFGSIPAFGSWSIDSYGYAGFEAYSFLIIVATIIIAAIYRIKFSEYLKSMVEGIKKALPAMLLIVIAYAILIITVYNPVFLNISHFLTTITDTFNVLTTSVAIMINSIFNIEIGYFAQNELALISGIFADSTIYPLIGMMFTALFSLMSLIMPTGLLLIATLSYTETSYFDWIKYIWKVFVGLLVICLIMFTLIYLL